MYDSLAVRMQQWTQVTVWRCAAFNTGDLIQREQPLFVRMLPDGVPGELRDVWVQLLRTVHGLADGTREWRNCFLATARGLGCETSVLEPCVLVLRSPQEG